jgi:hypothetical protein
MASSKTFLFTSECVSEGHPGTRLSVSHLPAGEDRRFSPRLFQFWKMRVEIGAKGKTNVGFRCE